jgi:hypothetical protein
MYSANRVELAQGVVQSIRLRNPQRASVFEATEDVETETHIRRARQ